MRGQRTILFVSRWCGIAGPSLGLAQLVEETLRRGHRVHLLVPRRDPINQALEAKGASVCAFPGLRLILRPSRPGALLRYLAKSLIQCTDLIRQVRAVGAHALCVNGENIPLVPWCGRLLSCPTVVVVRGARFTETGRLGRLYFAVQRRSGASYLAVSHAVRRGLEAMGVPAERIRVVYNGVDVDRFAPGPPQAALGQQLGIVPGEPVLGAICHLEHRKGIHHLVDIMVRLRRVVPEAVCLVVSGTENAGQQAYVRQLHRQVRSAGLEDRLRFLGARSDVDELLRLVDVLVHPAETEAFGRVIVEAMATGKPVVGFDVGAVPELVDDGQTGFVVPPFDTARAASVVATLLHDAELRRRLGAAGRARAVAEFRLETNIRAAVDIVEAGALDCSVQSSPAYSGRRVVR